MRTYIFIPPVKRPTGGVYVLLDLAGHLAEAGFQVTLAMREHAPGWENHAPAKVQVVAWNDADPGPGDVWLVPEGWPGALTPGVKANARCVVYCQNWAYLFSGLPDELDLAGLPLEFIAVSEPTAVFIEATLGVRPPVLRPGIDPGLFSRPDSKPPADPVRVAYMPRKNKAQAEGIRKVYRARQALGRAPKAEWVEIAGQTRAGVAGLLSTCHVFLATGFPEGCPLPPLEAMACGCLPVGFAGFGGFDYMRPLDEQGYRPALPLREVPWGANGFWTADADVLGAALALETAAKWVVHGDFRLDAALSAGQATARAYSMQKQREDALEIWRSLA